jgi:hypothetical protein
MNREQLQHIIRAAASICEEPDFVVIGSQAIHGSLLDTNEIALVRSMEADIYPLHAPEKSQLLNVIGELSDFHTAFGYYADGVDESTAILPAGWRDRVVTLCGPLTANEQGFEARGLCLEIHDLVISKLVAGREKDIEFFRVLVRMGKLDGPTLRTRLRRTSLNTTKRRLLRAKITAEFPDIALQH